MTSQQRQSCNSLGRCGDLRRPIHGSCTSWRRSHRQPAASLRCRYMSTLGLIAIPCVFRPWDAFTRADSTGQHTLQCSGHHMQCSVLQATDRKREHLLLPLPAAGEQQQGGPVYQGAPAPEGSFASMARCLLQRLPDASRAKTISAHVVGASPVAAQCVPAMDAAGRRNGWGVLCRRLAAHSRTSCSRPSLSSDVTCRPAGGRGVVGGAGAGGAPGAAGDGADGRGAGPVRRDGAAAVLRRRLPQRRAWPQRSGRRCGTFGTFGSQSKASGAPAAGVECFWACCGVGTSQQRSMCAGTLHRQQRSSGSVVSDMAADGGRGGMSPTEAFARLPRTASADSLLARSAALSVMLQLCRVSLACPHCTC
jgi:hypothetical protein